MPANRPATHPYKATLGSLASHKVPFTSTQVTDGTKSCTYQLKINIEGHVRQFLFLTARREKISCEREWEKRG